MGLKYEFTPGLSSKSCYTYVLERLGIILQQELDNFIQEQFSIQILLIEPLTRVCLVCASDICPHICLGLWVNLNLSSWCFSAIYKWPNTWWSGVQKPGVPCSRGHRRILVHIALCGGDWCQQEMLHAPPESPSGEGTSWEGQVLHWSFSVEQDWRWLHAMAFGPMDKRGIFPLFSSLFFTSSPFSPLICSLVSERGKWHFSCYEIFHSLQTTFCFLFQLGKLGENARWS